MLQKIIISVYSNLEMIIVQCVVSASIKFVVVQSGILMIDVVVYFFEQFRIKGVNVERVILFAI